MKVERKKMAFVEVDITSIASSGNNARRDRWQIDAIQVRTPYGSATRAPLVYAVRRFLLRLLHYRPFIFREKILGAGRSFRFLTRTSRGKNRLAFLYSAVETVNTSRLIIG